jgi:tetratricopeptide (TPR) repeat protein
LGDAWGLSFVYWGIGVCRHALGQLDEALAFVDKALAAARALADPKIGARIHTLRAQVLCALGRLDVADGAARDAVREATRASLPRERAEAQLVLALVLQARGFGRRAQQAAEQAAEIAKVGGVEEVEARARALIDDVGGSITGER